jgi:hypothetical protein
MGNDMRLSAVSRIVLHHGRVPGIEIHFARCIAQSATLDSNNPKSLARNIDLPDQYKPEFRLLSRRRVVMHPKFFPVQFESASHIRSCITGGGGGAVVQHLQPRHYPATIFPARPNICFIRNIIEVEDVR